MPQMKPMSWLTILFATLMLIMTVMVFTFFMPAGTAPKSKSKSKLIKKIKSMKWKW